MGKQQKIKYLVIAVTFLLILITGILTKQKFILIVPLFASLFIMAFQAEANRFAALAGGINALLYSAVYFYLGLYASSASALLLSFPMQIVTFINWQKHAYGKTTIFKKLSTKMRTLLVCLFICLWFIIFIILKSVGSDYAILDNTVTLLGILVSLLTAAAYIEYSYLWILSAFANVLLNIQVVCNDPRQITYVIYSVYSLFCVILAFINVRKIYKQQKAEGL